MGAKMGADQDRRGGTTPLASGGRGCYAVSVVDGLAHPNGWTPRRDPQRMTYDLHVGLRWLGSHFVLGLLVRSHETCSHAVLGVIASGTRRRFIWLVQHCWRVTCDRSSAVL